MVADFFQRKHLGIEGFDVDGNDIVAVDDLTGELTRRIRAGDGPMFVTARTYRLMGHTTSDAGGYRTEDEVAEHWGSDPVARCESRYNPPLPEKAVVPGNLANPGSRKYG